MTGQVIDVLKETDAINREIFNCNKCFSGLWDRAYPMFGFYGSNCYKNIAIIAQNPGLPNEAQKKKKFTYEETFDDYIEGLLISKIGNFLEQILPEEFSFNNVFYTNVVKCALKPGLMLEPDELEVCAEYLKRQLEVVKPKIIICIGKIAYYQVRPEGDFSKDVHRTIKTKNNTLLTLFHPSYISRLEKAEAEKYIKEVAERVKSVIDEK